MEENKKKPTKRSTKKEKKEVVVEEVILPSKEEVVEILEEKEEKIEEVIVAVEEKVQDIIEIEITETVQIERKLSRQAERWASWLNYQRMSPEDFLKRYPTHKFIHFVQEIIDFNAGK